MESQDAGNAQKPLSFENLDDIPSIDGDDASPSGTGHMTGSPPPSPDKHQGDDSKSIETQQNSYEFSKSERGSEVAKSTFSEGGTERLDPSVDISDKMDNDINKIDEDTSCNDDTPLDSMASRSSAHDEINQHEDCVSHSFSFALRAEGHSKGLAASENTETPLDESRMSDSQALVVSQDSSTTSKTKGKTKKVKKTANKDGRDSDSSVSSRKRGSSNKTRIKSKFAPGSFQYIEERLTGHIFSGWVDERRWVENLAGYRDVIEVDEWEVEMNLTLLTIIRSIPGVQEGKRWINITTPTEKEASYCLWCLLSTPPTPGHYWFTVTGVSIHPQFGLRIMLRIIRSIHPHDGELAASRRKRRKELASREPGHELETFGEQFQDWLQQVKQVNLSVIWTAFSSTFTISNIKEAIRFLLVLSMTIVVGLVTFVKESHHYGIQFLHTAGVFFRNITPFLQSLLAFVEKIIGGMYLLIAMVYNDIRRPSVARPPQPTPTRPPLAIVDNQGFTPMHTPGQRTVKYVPPEQWVYKSQNTSSSNS